MQLFLGSATPFFALPACDYEPSLKIRSEISQHCCPPLPHENDCSIMDLAVSHRLSMPIIKSIKRCRIYLQVLFLLDMVSSDGQTILPEVLDGIPPIDRDSKLEWMTQLSPCHKDWNHWSVFLQYFTRNGKLRNPLGWWTNPTHQHWQWFRDPDSHVYHICHINNSCSLYLPARLGYNTQNRGWTYSQCQECEKPEVPLVPITRLMIGTYTLFHCARSSSPLVTEPPEAVQTLIHHAILSRFFLACSDGSHDSGKEAHGWVLSTSTGETLWQGSGPTDGHPKLTSAF